MKFTDSFFQDNCPFLRTCSLSVHEILKDFHLKCIWVNKTINTWVLPNRWTLVKSFNENKIKSGFQTRYPLSIWKVIIPLKQNFEKFFIQSFASPQVLISYWMPFEKHGQFHANKENRKQKSPKVQQSLVTQVFRPEGSKTLSLHFPRLLF